MTVFERWDIGGLSVGEKVDLKMPVRLGKSSVTVVPNHFVAKTEEAVMEMMKVAVETIKNFGAEPHAWLTQRPMLDEPTGYWLATLVLVGELAGPAYVYYDTERGAVPLSGALVGK